MAKSRTKLVVKDISRKKVNFIIDKDSVSLTVFPRIHFFSLDLSTLSGDIKHGAMGVSLERLPIKITARKATNDTIKYTNLDQLDGDIVLQELRDYIDKNDFWDIRVDGCGILKPHTGLGLSTQIKGGILLCCAKISGRTMYLEDLYRLGIGQTSTLGIKLLFSPKCIIETGVQNKTISPTVYTIDNLPFYTIVCIPKNTISLSGSVEDQFWNKILPDKPLSSLMIVYETLENLIPSITEKNFIRFIESFHRITTTGTKPAEIKMQAPETVRLLENLKKIFGFASLSSLGPVLYAFSQGDPSEKIAKLNASHDSHVFYYF